MATSVQLRLATTDDAISESNETFTLTANPVSGATAAPASATATITDNDGTPQFSINDVTVNEGAGTISFTVSLSIPGASSLSVDYAAVSDTATVGLAGSDVTAGTSALAGTLIFAPGTTSQTVTLNVTNDNIYEISEAFNVNLSNASAGAGIADGVGIGTIKDDGTGSVPPGTPADNDTPVLSIANINVAEGDPAVFTVSISNPSTTAVVFTPVLTSGTPLGRHCGHRYGRSQRAGVQQRYPRRTRVVTRHRQCEHPRWGHLRAVALGHHR